MCNVHVTSSNLICCLFRSKPFCLNLCNSIYLVKSHTAIRKNKQIIVEAKRDSMSISFIFINHESRANIQLLGIFLKQSARLLNEWESKTVLFNLVEIEWRERVALLHLSVVSQRQSLWRPSQDKKLIIYRVNSRDELKALIDIAVIAECLWFISTIT